MVTHAASPAAGCAPACRPLVRAAFAALFDLSSTPGGRTAAAVQLRLCEDGLLAGGNAPLVALFLMMAFNTAAMGSVPYKYSYFTGRRSRWKTRGGGGEVRVCCGAGMPGGFVLRLPLSHFGSLSGPPHAGDPDHPLPAWPLRAMCETMGEAAETSDPKELLGVSLQARGVKGVGCHAITGVPTI